MAVPNPAASGDQTFAEGKDYSVWQRARVLDQNGFGQPVEAYSILVPKGWRTEGGVNWVINVTCPADAVLCGSTHDTCPPKLGLAYAQATAESPQAAADEIAADFEFLDDWGDRYQYLIELGEKLPPMPDVVAVARAFSQ